MRQSLDHFQVSFDEKKIFIILAVLRQSVQPFGEAQLRSIAPKQHRSFAQMLQWFGNTLSDLTGPKFKPQTPHAFGTNTLGGFYLPITRIYERKYAWYIIFAM